MKREVLLIHNGVANDLATSPYDTFNPRRGRHFAFSVNCGVKNDFTAVANIHAPKLQLPGSLRVAINLEIKVRDFVGCN